MKNVTQHGFATEINILTSNVVFDCLKCKTFVFTITSKELIYLL